MTWLRTIVEVARTAAGPCSIWSLQDIRSCWAASHWTLGRAGSGCDDAAALLEMAVSDAVGGRRLMLRCDLVDVRALMTRLSLLRPQSPRVNIDWRANPRAEP